MIHSYTRNCYRVRDGRHFVEQRTIRGEQVAIEMGGYNRSGNRADFLELVNRWNRQGFNVAAGLIYSYVAN